MENLQVTVTWEDFATVKIWKRGLQAGSNKNRMSDATLKAMRYYFPMFLEYKKMNPDEIIEEALVGRRMVVMDSLSDFCNWLQDVKHKSYNESINGSHAVVRGFYSHNEINTQKIKIPKREPSIVATTDDNFPLYDIVTVVKEDGKKKKVKRIKRALLQRYFNYLNLRDKTVLMCIMSTGADTGDILKWTLGMVRYQQSESGRIFIRKLRNKTSEEAAYFLTKEATKYLMDYILTFRRDAEDHEPIFVISRKEFKTTFRKLNGRKFDPERDEFVLPPLRTGRLSFVCREATEKLQESLRAEGKNIKLLFDGQQSPARPKRFRKLFASMCDDANIPKEIKRFFMGKADPSNDAYIPKDRIDLELYYEEIEPKLTIFSDPESQEAAPVTSKLIIDMQKQHEQEMNELEERITGKFNKLIRSFD